MATEDTTGEFHVPDAKPRAAVAVAATAGASAIAGAVVFITNVVPPGGRTFDSLVMGGFAVMAGGHAWHTHHLTQVTHHFNAALAAVQKSGVEDAHYVGEKINDLTTGVSERINELTAGVAALAEIESQLAKRPRLIKGGGDRA